LKILPSFRSEYDVNRYQGIENALKRATHQELEQRYRTPLEFYNSVKQYFLTLIGWRFQLKLNEYLCVQVDSGNSLLN